MHLGLPAREHIDIRSGRIICRANIKYTSGDVEWCGATFVRARLTGDVPGYVECCNYCSVECGS